MCDPLPIRGERKKFGLFKANIRKFTNNPIVFLGLLLLLFGSIARLLFSQPTYYAKASAAMDLSQNTIKSPLFEAQAGIFDKKEAQISQQGANYISFEKDDRKCESSELFAKKIYDLVGESPIKEMVPYISRRDQRVAAFLVGIAKKESSFGFASPSKDGKSCYNFWGFKGQGTKGESMGYACFGSAQEAVERVGNRIETLVEKNRTTPAKMVDTWKCGVSCSGDPGAPGWVATVTLYFEKLVS